MKTMILIAAMALGQGSDMPRAWSTAEVLPKAWSERTPYESVLDEAAASGKPVAVFVGIPPIQSLRWVVWSEDVGRTLRNPGVAVGYVKNGKLETAWWINGSPSKHQLEATILARSPAPTKSAATHAIPTNATHSHKCPFCKTEWWHDDGSFGNAAAHRCPNCGAGPVWPQHQRRSAQSFSSIIQQPAARQSSTVFSKPCPT